MASIGDIMHDFLCRLFNRNCAEDNDRHVQYTIEEPDHDLNVAPIPEPASAVLMVAGALVVGYFVRKR